MKRLSSILILLIVFSLVGKTAVMAFYPDVLTVSVAANSWAEESAEEDESGEDDKTFHHNSAIAPGAFEKDFLVRFDGSRLLNTPREIVAPPPQA